MKFAEQKGKFIKHCPCTPDAISCGYYNINLHTGCPYDCSYCILQAYLESPEPIFFTNFDELEKELQGIVVQQPALRIGTGELTDSLALDHLSHYSKKLLSLFENFPTAVFEFKTKSANVGHLLEIEKVPPNIVVSWSLNPQQIIEREELKTPSLTQRLQAMVAVQAKGYRVGIHFDPIIYCQEWKTFYEVLIKKIAAVIVPKQVAWWSLGALRFPYALREHIFKHKNSHLFEGELIKGYDDKYRYFKPLRLEMFHFVISKIYQYISKEVPLYLCMEDDEAWQELLPHIKPDEETVNRYLYQFATTKG